jgi:uncharacterized protein YndB with AHSA1/START domain
MATSAVLTQGVEQLAILKEEEIAAPIEIVFESILEQMGPGMETPDGKSLSMKLEAWPGGRWYRDLGNNNGHLWGHVQAIKAPELLEVYGPLFMSGAVISGLQYRLTAEGGTTRVRLEHKAVGLIPPGALDGVRVGQGWTSMLMRVRETSEGKVK